MKPQRGRTPKRPPVGKRTSKQTDPVEVFCRIRPLFELSAPTCLQVVNATSVQLTSTENSHAMRNGGPVRETLYTFGYVFDDQASQKAMFDRVALPLVEDILFGKNALLFTYGVTSSGKTHTMTGTPQNQGVLPRCFDVIFNSIGDLQAKKYVFKPDKMNGFDVQTVADAMMERQQRDIMPRMTQCGVGGTPRGERCDANRTPRTRDPSSIAGLEEDNNYSVFVSFVEIYNNYIYDLLDEPVYDTITGSKPPQSKILREDSNHVMYVSGVIEIEVKSTEEAYEVITRGQKRRKVAHTVLNTESSRSHSVFNIRLVQAPLDSQGEEVLQDRERIVISQFSLVDLAGSERTNRTGNNGERLREAGNINQTLMVLRTCIESLRDNQQNGTNKMVAYRDSRLTHLFKNYFDGEGKVSMVVCVNPHANEYDETIQVMRFAEMTQEVQVARPQTAIFRGLTPGRRRRNQEYKEAVIQAAADGVEPPMLPPMIVYTWPPFPSLRSADSFESSGLDKFAEFLRERQLRRSSLLTDYTMKENQFRCRLLDVDKEQARLRMRVSELEASLKASETENAKTRRRMKEIEKAYTTLQRTATVYENDRQQLEKELDEREYKIMLEKSEKDRLKQDYHAKLTLTEHTYNRQIDMTKKRFKDENSARLRQKQQKLDMLRNIINDTDADTASIAGSEAPAPHTLPRRGYAGTRIYPAKSDPNLASHSGGRPPITPRSTPHRPGASVYAQPTTNRYTAPRASRARSPPPVKPKPMTNSRYHRRSRSADTWLEHRPEGTIETGTLLQPKMKKKRSVTRLMTKDIEKSAKYVLTHQDVDSDGTVSTKLVKGGGRFANTTVVLDCPLKPDLPHCPSPFLSPDSSPVSYKQSLIALRKRKSKSLHADDFDGDWTDVETRCKIGIEGHGIPKRPKQSAV